MANERLRAAIHDSGRSVTDVATHLEVDRKTVERWVAGRAPYRRHRYALAKFLGADPAYLWPTSADSEAAELARAEVVSIWPTRSMVTNDVWLRLFEQASARIDILVYAGFWLSEDPAIRGVLAHKARSGIDVRLLLGDPSGAEVQQRGVDEGIGSAIPAKIINALHNFRDLANAPGAQLRLHDTVLYNSIYRADDEMLVNTHLYGEPAHMAPLVHLRHVPGAELFSRYGESFERVWVAAHPFESASLVA